ncbi:MAG: cell envelope integrity protein TolA [Chitinophagaceae bacterium]|nr:cell envelope integrity protein TolA [Chitinophagaceae bacterium]
MRSIRNTSRFTVLVLILMILAFGCKSKKKAMEASNAEKERARIEQETALRKQEEDARKLAEEERLRNEEAARQQQQNEATTLTPKAKLSGYFDAIASSSSVTAANTSINEALTLFASPEAQVLIVISGSGDQKDYDRPTTIKEYLHYLKDQKKNINAISELKVDSAGKITEVELRKN